MRKLCEDIVRSYGERREFIESLRSAHEEMGHRLMADLARGREKLTAGFASTRSEFKKKAKAIRADLEGAKRLWNEATEQLEEMRRKRKG
jgi:hypothetical protein